MNAESASVHKGPLPKPGKYIIYSEQGRVLGVQVVMSCEDSVVVETYRNVRQTSKGRLFDFRREMIGYWEKPTQSRPIMCLGLDYRVILGLSTRKNIDKALSWDSGKWIREYIPQNSFFTTQES